MNQDLKKTLWAAADKLRSSMDAAEYKHIVLGLIFLKYISDAFDERRHAAHTRGTLRWDISPVEGNVPFVFRKGKRF